MKKIFYEITKFTLGLTLLVAALLIGLSLTIYTNDNLRHAAFRSVAEAPESGFYLLLRRAVISRHFDEAAHILQRQLDFITWSRVSKSVMLPGLINNTRFVIDLASTKEEWATLIPYLKNLTKADDNIHSAHLWLARSLANDDPRTALRHLEQAVALSGPEPEPFRWAIKISLENGLMEELRNWCENYRTTQFGGTRPYDYNNRFLETSARRMALRVTNQDGQFSYYGYRNFVIGRENTIHFDFESPLALHGLALELSLAPGFKIAVDNAILQTSTGTRTYSSSTLNIFAKNGYYVGDGFVTISQNGEILDFIGPPVGTENVSAVKLNVTATRVAFSNQKLCDGPSQ